MATLEISKQFECAKEKLYEAWTSPDQLKQWWKPGGNQLIAVENDVEPGGKIKYQFEKDELLIDGAYDKVEEGLLEYSWNWHVKAEPIPDTAYKLSIQVDGDEQATSLHIKQDGFSDDEHIKPHQQGWEDALEKLKIFVEGGKHSEAPGTTGTPGTAGADQHPPITGYMETPEQQKVGGG